MQNFLYFCLIRSDSLSFLVKYITEKIVLSLSLEKIWNPPVFILSRRDDHDFSCLNKMHCTGNILVQDLISRYPNNYFHSQWIKRRKLNKKHSIWKQSFEIIHKNIILTVFLLYFKLQIKLKFYRHAFILTEMRDLI